MTLAFTLTLTFALAVVLALGNKLLQRQLAIVVRVLFGEALGLFVGMLGLANEFLLGEESVVVLVLFIENLLRGGLGFGFGLAAFLVAGIERHGEGETDGE